MKNIGYSIALMVSGVIMPVMAACAAPAQPPASHADVTTIFVDNATSVTLNIFQLSGKPDEVELVYFYTEDPCPCRATVKDNLNYAIETYFKNDVASGRVKLTMVKSDDPANADLLVKYDAPLFALFIKETRGDEEKIYPVSEIWTMTGDENRDKLINFIRTKISRILEELKNNSGNPRGN
jgi:hypothetical protein